MVRTDQSDTKQTHMHARLPPMNVILWLTLANTVTHRGTDTTRRWEYIPGICASTTASGRGESHLSGFHSYESAPQSPGLQFAPNAETMIFVPLAINISDLCRPSVHLTGFDRGRMTSLLALRFFQLNPVRFIEQQHTSVGRPS